MTEPIGRWCVGCDAELPPPTKDKYGIQVCPVCSTEQPHGRA